MSTVICLLKLKCRNGRLRTPLSLQVYFHSDFCVSLYSKVLDQNFTSEYDKEKAWKTIRRYLNENFEYTKRIYTHAGPLIHKKKIQKKWEVNNFTYLIIFWDTNENNLIIVYILFK